MRAQQSQSLNLAFFARQAEACLLPVLRYMLPNICRPNKRVVAKPPHLGAEQPGHPILAGVAGSREAPRCAGRGHHREHFSLARTIMSEVLCIYKMRIFRD